MAPLKLRISDALNPRERVSGVAVVDEVTGSRATTNSQGEADFFTDREILDLTATKEGYNKKTESVNRLQRCSDPTNCVIEITMAKKLPGGAIIIWDEVKQRKDCFFAFLPGGSETEFSIRAVLNWNDKPGDLDLWARPVDTSDYIRKKYNCYASFDAEFDRSIDEGSAGRCTRSQFRTSSVRDAAIRDHGTTARSITTASGGVIRTWIPAEGTGSYTKCSNDPSNADCEPKWSNTYSSNQFAKWTYWSSRGIDKPNGQLGYWPASWLDSGESGQTNQRVKLNWGADWASVTKSWIVLDVDVTSGSGPETITFRTVPVGTYQVVVDLYSKSTGSIAKPNPPGGNWPDNAIQSSNARIALYLGSGSDVSFECTIPSTCTVNPAYLWSAFDFSIQPNGTYGPVEGVTKNAYTVRIYDSKETIKKMAYFGMPPGHSAGRVRRQQFVAGRRRDNGYYTSAPSEDYFPSRIGTSGSTAYSDAQASVNACYGTCEPAAHARGADKCLYKYGR
jgi:hypothetical protein